MTRRADLRSAGAEGRALVDDLRAHLAAAADPGRADGMRRYLKSELPCHGVYTPEMKQIWREVIPRHPLPDRGSYEATVRVLWDGATHREDRYAALAVTDHRLYRAYQDPAALPLYDHLVVTGAWWDLVDVVATRRLGRIRRAFPDDLDPVMRTWADDPDLWRRRTAVICQVGGKDAHRHRAARRRPRAQPRPTGVLPPQGGRLGAPGLLMDRPGVGTRLRLRPAPTGCPRCRGGRLSSGWPDLPARPAHEPRISQPHPSSTSAWCSRA